MIKEALKYLVEMGGIYKESLLDGSQIVTSGEYNKIVRMPVLEPISCNTLTGIVDFINMNNANAQTYKILMTPICIHIISHARVELIGDFTDDWTKKTVYVEAKSEVFDIKIVTKSLLEFSPWVQTFFVQDNEASYILDNLSKITAFNGLVVTDKGVSLEVETKKNIHFKENDKIRSQVTLRPFRTFPEIEQPESVFVLRIHEGVDGIMIALHQAVDPTWKIRAIYSIRKFFEKNISDSAITILA